jgi:hypothetical protein
VTEAAKNQRWHQRLRAQLKREQHAKEREALAHLRRRVTDLRIDRKRAVCKARTLCRTERARIKAATRAAKAALRRAREELKRKRLELVRRARTLRDRAAVLCTRRTERAKKLHALTLVELARARAEHRTVAAALRDLDRGGRLRKTTAAERRGESDDAVRTNIPADLVSVFDRIRRHIVPKPGRSRTEAFLEWVEAHPDEVWAMHSERAAKELRALEREERQRLTQLRKTRARLTELEAVLF